MLKLHDETLPCSAAALADAWATAAGGLEAEASGSCLIATITSTMKSAASMLHLQKH